MYYLVNVRGTGRLSDNDGLGMQVSGSSPQSAVTAFRVAHPGGSSWLVVEVDAVDTVDEVMVSSLTSAPYTPA